jgi:phosphoesterase RecJ-like protein
MQMLLNSELKCDSNIAQLLYMGLVSDSNRFLFNSCTSETFSLVSTFLKDYPFDLSESYHKLYLRPLSEVRLEGYIELNMIVTENNLGYIVISDELINQFGVDSASAGNMINNFNFIKGVLVWATITEDVKNSQYRISIRSRGPEINKVAERHNGGGHKYASGVRVETLEKALAVMNDLDEELSNYNKMIDEGEII